jgi:phytoene dehydrogenase-like protein
MGLPGADPEADAADIVDALEVIRWYQTLIGPKLHRALSGQADADILDDDGNPFPRDSDGSAKIALIAMDRSLAAWDRLRRYFPDKGDSVLNILVYLARLRRAVEKEFPAARAFQRPGFDFLPPLPADKPGAKHFSRSASVERYARRAKRRTANSRRRPGRPPTREMGQ